jgi:hypothetical protein
MSEAALSQNPGRATTRPDTSSCQSYGADILETPLLQNVEPLSSFNIKTISSISPKQSHDNHLFVNMVQEIRAQIYETKSCVHCNAEELQLSSHLHKPQSLVYTECFQQSVIKLIITIYKYNPLLLFTRLAFVFLPMKFNIPELK